MSNHPECDKLDASYDKLVLLRDFLEWLQDPKRNGTAIKDDGGTMPGTPITLAIYPVVVRRGQWARSDDLEPYFMPEEHLLLRFLGIDRDKLDVERRTILKAQREANRAKARTPKDRDLDLAEGGGQEDRDPCLSGDG